MALHSLLRLLPRFILFVVTVLPPLLAVAHFAGLDSMDSTHSKIAVDSDIKVSTSLSKGSSCLWLFKAGSTRGYLHRSRPRTASFTSGSHHDQRTGAMPHLFGNNSRCSSATIHAIFDPDIRDHYSGR